MKSKVFGKRKASEIQTIEASITLSSQCLYPNLSERYPPRGAAKTPTRETDPRMRLASEADSCLIPVRYRGRKVPMKRTPICLIAL